MQQIVKKEFKTRHGWVEKVIHWELCKKFKFGHSNKWYMHQLESALENETHKIHKDCEIQIAHLIQARKPDLKIILKKEKKKESKRKKKRENSDLWALPSL